MAWAAQNEAALPAVLRSAWDAIPRAAVSPERRRPRDEEATTSESGWPRSSAGERKSCGESSVGRGDGRDARARFQLAKYSLA